MRNYFKDVLGIDYYQPIDIKENKFLVIGNKGRCYPNEHTIYIMKFDSDIYKNIYPKIKSESVELSFKTKKDTMGVFNYLLKFYNKVK